jgi:hypothetical protein
MPTIALFWRGRQLRGSKLLTHAAAELLTFTTFERRILKSGVIPFYRVGRTFLFDGLLQKFRSDQIRRLQRFYRNR